MTKTILTGVKPTGAPHIGNYIGAIQPALQLAAEAEKSFLFIADYHALNAVRAPEAIRRDSYEVAATWLALGLDPEKTAFYRQSDVPEIFEIMNLLCSVTPKGLMDRAHSYKAAMDKNKAEGRGDVDHGINMGLYTYPLLMAADILAMNTDIVPVGKDQIQHIEFARDMAGYFNSAFGNVFRLPAHRLGAETAATLPGLDGRKMSKSYDNHIPVFMESKARRKRVMKIVTDSKLPEEKKEAGSNTIFQLYAHLATASEIAEMKSAFEKGGMGYGDAKQKLFEVLERTFEEPTRIYADYMADTKKVDALLAAGAARARPVARQVLSAAREACGLRKL